MKSNIGAQNDKDGPNGRYADGGLLPRNADSHSCRKDRFGQTGTRMSALETTQRSIAAMASAGLRRDVCQVCDGGPRCRIMYLETVDSAISNPSFSSSPWMRGAPHNGFSLLIR
jgi:hypothetical protein